eukprot:GHRQ01021717.1.p1 GENE.GHRQ01021717.1~~GHRQ01021717.1.p1  ORF type:complete len:134 (-),score=9.60 GHRQ01021717.1:106-507(-)
MEHRPKSCMLSATLLCSWPNARGQLLHPLLRFSDNCRSCQTILLMGHSASLPGQQPKPQSCSCDNPATNRTTSRIHTKTAPAATSCLAGCLDEVCDVTQARFLVLLCQLMRDGRIAAGTLTSSHEVHQLACIV